MITKRHRSPDTPSWAQSLQPGIWYRLSGDRPAPDLPPTAVGTRYLNDNDPAADAALNPPTGLKERIRRLLGRDNASPWHGRVGFPAITEAWNGAVYASRAGPSGAMVIFGGGHNNYFGSDVHAFDLDSREWRRLTNGFISGGPRAYGQGAVYPDAVYPDGSPLPPHTYDYVQYDDRDNNYLLLKGQTELGPQVKATPIPHLFNLDRRTWRHGPRHPRAILNSGGFTTWDPGRRLLWGHSGDDGGGNAFVAYSPDGVNADGTVGSWPHCHPNKLPGRANHNAMQLDPGADRIVVAVHADDALVSIDPNRPDRPPSEVISYGEKPRLQPYAALRYSPRLRKLVYYSAVNGATVYAVQFDGAVRWRALTAAGSLDPIEDAARQSRFKVNVAHTFGRFRIASFADFDVAILVRHVDSPVYAMRLPD